MAEKGEVLVEVKNMNKNFGVTVALHNVSMTIKRGEIRGLIGEYYRQFKKPEQEG